MMPFSPGMGLYEAKSLTEIYFRGRISLQSKENEGTKVRVELPIVATKSPLYSFSSKPASAKMFPLRILQYISPVFNTMMQLIYGIFGKGKNRETGAIEIPPTDNFAQTELAQGQA
jgi:hypothetical protein